jgi:Ser/Thr protein kinase RdoA (MazF antagonist)
LHNLRREISREANWLDERLQELDESLVASGLSRVIIHGDYGPYNVFFKPGAPIMILDLELSRLDWRMTDLANAAYFFALGRSGFRFSHLARFFEGYFSVNPDARSEIVFFPDVWQFLLLRRVIVCWRRALETPAGQWQAEAQRKLNLAHWIEDHRGLLSNPA